jgi:RHS repeat-associated protein
MGRLETASGAFGAITYDYDPIGNLLSRDAVGGSDPGQMDLFYEGGTSPLVERVETTPEGHGTIVHDVVHDAMGNILDDGVSRYFWDPRPIMRFHKQGGTSAYYRYSDYTAAGTMMARRGYTVDPVVYYAQMVTMESPSGQRLSDLLWNMDGDVFEGRDLVWLGDRLIATFEVAASDPDYVFTDHIGYPLMVMDPSANTTWSAVHEPYGEAVLTGGTTAGDPLLRYPGQWKDDPAFVVTDPPQRNLFANGYRWYNPDWGRYTQSDPIGIRGGPNPYLYARANPLFFIDPLGLVEVACPCEYEDPVKQAHGDVVAAGTGPDNRWAPLADCFGGLGRNLPWIVCGTPEECAQAGSRDPYGFTYPDSLPGIVFLCPRGLQDGCELRRTIAHEIAHLCFPGLSHQTGDAESGLFGAAANLGCRRVTSPPELGGGLGRNP